MSEINAMTRPSRRRSTVNEIEDSLQAAPVEGLDYNEIDLDTTEEEK